MSTLGLICVGLGALMIVSRAPLIFAPEWQRSLIVSWLEKPGFIRGFGVFALALGAGLAFFTNGAAEPIAGVLFFFGGFLTAVGVLLIFFADSGQALALSVWKSFNTNLLRLFGVIAVLLGAYLISFGLSL